MPRCRERFTSCPVACLVYRFAHAFVPDGQRRQPVNQPLNMLPSGLLVDCAWPQIQGISRTAIHDDVLEQVASRIYRRVLMQGPSGRMHRELACIAPRHTQIIQAERQGKNCMAWASSRVLGAGGPSPRPGRHGPDLTCALANQCHADRASARSCNAPAWCGRLLSGRTASRGPFRAGRRPRACCNRNDGKKADAALIRPWSAVAAKERITGPTRSLNGSIA